MFILAAVGAAAVSGYPGKKAGSALEEHKKLPLEMAQVVGPMPISLWPTQIEKTQTELWPGAAREQLADAARVGLREAETIRAAQVPNTAWTSLKIDTKPDQRIDTKPDHTISSPKVSADAPKQVRLSASITGLWAPASEACSESPDGEYLPMRLTSAQATAGDATCDFISGRPSGRAWDLVAQCSDGVTDWVSDVRLSVNNGELTWASQKGTQTYVRCGPVATAGKKASRAKVAKAKRKVQKLAASRPSGPGIRVISGAAVPVSWVFVRAR